MWLIIGLGNPGAEYAGTRHNVGFEVIDRLARRHNIPVQKRGFQSLYGDGAIAGERVILVKPMTYMNLSGEAVTAIARYYKVDPEHIIVVLDEVALAPGQLRLRFQGSAGGHNGLANIVQHMGTTAVPRIRIGVGAARPGKLVSHVLSRFPADEQPLLEEAYESSADAVESAITVGFENAMNRFNTKPASESKITGASDDPQNAP